MTAAPVLAVRGATQALRRRDGARRRRPRRPPRRGARAPRRQRRRQVDADQVPERRAPLDSGVDRDGRRPVAIHSPADARALGIETVYQDLALFDNLRPSDNFYAGRELAGPRWLPRSLRVIKRREMADETREVLDRLAGVVPDSTAPSG